MVFPFSMVASRYQHEQDQHLHIIYEKQLFLQTTEKPGLAFKCLKHLCASSLTL